MLTMRPLSKLNNNDDQKKQTNIELELMIAHLCAQLITLISAQHTGLGAG